MTHLEVLNNVLRRLREDEATAIDDTDYIKMISDFVNDAMDMVQNVHNWSSLFVDIDITTVDTVQEYAITGLGQLGQIYYAYNDTSDCELKETSLSVIKRNTDMSTSTASSPTSYAFSSVSAADDPRVSLWPIPDGAYDLTFSVKQHQGAVTDGATEILVPEQPVIQLALAMAKEERGEDGSQGSSNSMGKAKAVLSDYVALDIERHPEITTWMVE